MSKTKTQKMSMAASLIIAVLAFGAFAGAATLVTKNQLGTTAVSSADDGEGSDGDNGGDSEDGGGNSGDSQDSSSSESEKKKDEKASEAAKKQTERERESAKKQYEQSNKGSDDEGDVEDSVDDEGDAEDGSNDAVDDTEDGSNDEGDVEDDANVVEENTGDDNAMYQDRTKTLNKLQEKIAEARKEILQKGNEGFDVTAALARLALAEAAYDSVVGAFDANNLDEVKHLVKETRKLTHFAREDDLQDAEKEAESKDHRSEVADFVKGLNDVADIEEGGIGKQVRTVARAQKLSADKAASLMEDAQRRSALAEFLIGPKTDDLDGINGEIMANNVRVAVLNRAIAQVEDADVKAMLSEQVATLQQETTKLTNFVNSQLDKSSLFGWLSAFFPKS